MGRRKKKSSDITINKNFLFALLLATGTFALIFSDLLEFLDKL